MSWPRRPRTQFPGCPPDRAVRLAVVASIRHEDTEYDRLLMGGIPRFDARQMVRPTIDEILERWGSGTIGP